MYRTLLRFFEVRRSFGKKDIGAFVADALPALSSYRDEEAVCPRSSYSHRSCGCKRSCDKAGESHVAMLRVNSQRGQSCEGSCAKVGFQPEDGVIVRYDRCNVKASAVVFVNDSHPRLEVLHVPSKYCRNEPSVCGLHAYEEP